jgi:CheY-like chemotaxis protein
MLGRVFDPYFSTKGQGRGLGLAVSRSIVVKHGGDIRVESTPGTGTEFTIHLPAVEGGIRDADPGPARATVASSGRVLVMDDEPAVAKVLSRMLTRLGAEVEVVADGAAALEAYHAARESGAPFALVITDLTVPGGMGGREMAVRLRAEDPGARIVVSSGYATDPIMSEYEEHGFADVLAKPYRLAEVAALLSRTMRAGPP